ncbi:MAG: hypothetical protein LBK59_09455, partial [Bifidobacteriaceae bacterium]|nr:hypothetical protein [Bifidobacteriaceae bacterium]
STAQPSASPSERPVSSASPSSRPVPSRSAVPTRRSADDAGPNLTVLMWVFAGLAVVCAAGSIPAALRARRRRRRWRVITARGGGAVGAAWSEVRDTARDLGLGAPVTETPRVFAERIAAWCHGAPGAPGCGGDQREESGSADGVADGLTRLLAAVEAMAFAGQDAGDVDADGVRAIVQRLKTVVTRRRRIRAAIWPISLVRALWMRRAGLWPPPHKGNY